MRSLTIFLGLILLTACKQFTLSKEDQKILAESDRLMEEQRELVESSTLKVIHRMNEVVHEMGSRPADVQVLEQTSNVWSKYKILSKQMGNWTGSDSIISIELYDESMSVFGEEMKHKVSLPFKDFRYYSKQQLELEFAWNFDQIVYYLNTRVGMGLVFYPLELVRIENSGVIKLFLFVKESSDLHTKIILPKTLSDSIHIQRLNSWTSVEYSDQEVVTLEYFDKTGQLKSKDFTELFDIKKLNR